MDIDLNDLFDDKFKSPFIKEETTNAAPIEAVVEEPAMPFVSARENIDKMNKALSEDSSEFSVVVQNAKSSYETHDSLEDAQHYAESEEEKALISDVYAAMAINEASFEAAQDVLYSNKQYQVEEEKVLVVEGEVVEENTPLNEAMRELKAEQEGYEESEVEADELREAIRKMQREIDAAKAKYTKIMDTRYEVRTKIKTLETRVTVEAHAEAEKRKEEEIKAKRKGAMLAFHKEIEELKPEWQKYAFDHQWEGSSTLALHGSSMLADEMGLGKTLTSIMWLDMVKAQKVLVVTPNDTNSNFTMELGIWAKHRFVLTLAGAAKDFRKMMMDGIVMPRVESEQDVTLSVNFEQLYSDEDYFRQLMAIKWDAIIIDEAHNFKEQKSVLFRKLLQLKNSNMVNGESVVKILPMTGTFILNTPEDIWPALHLIDPTAFPDIKSFRDYYCMYDYGKGRWVFRAGGERSLLIQLGGRIVKRNMKEAGIILPPQHIHDVVLEFGDGYKDQQRIMAQLAEFQIILDSERKTSIIEAIAQITRQRQCAVYPAGIAIKDPDTGEVMFSVGDEVTESIKIDWTIAKIKQLRESTEEFPNGERIAVFSQFKTALAEVERRLTEAGIRVVRYDGDTTKDVKMLVKRDFDRKHVEVTGEYQFDVVLCNYKTGGVGLNFTHATQLIALDEEWNPGKANQAFARTNRIGQTQENHVWIPRLAESIDDWMDALNKQKAQIIAGFDTEIDLQKEFSNFLETVTGGKK